MRNSLYKLHLFPSRALLTLLLLLTSSCDLLTGSDDNSNISDRIDPNGYSLHINPGDPVLISLPDGEGGVVQLLGEKSENGRAVRTIGIRRFRTDAPGEYDHVGFDESGFPSEAGTRDGSQLFFSYPGDGKVVMTVATADGSIESVAFDWYNYGSAVSLDHGVILQSSAAAATARLRVAVREDVPERTAVEDARVDGYWQASSDRYSHLPFVARHVGGGDYETSVPVGKANLKETEISELCELIPEVVNEGCEVLKRGGANRDFWKLALLACVQLRIPKAVAACTVAIPVIQFGCVALPPCESVTRTVDKYLRLNQRVEVRGNVRSGDFTRSFSSEVEPPFSNAATVEVLVPPRGWGGRWVGTWRGTSAGAAPGPGPLIITMRQTGTQVTGSYDLTYAITNFSASVQSGTLVINYPFGAGAQARVTLAKNQNSLSGSHVDTYPNQVLTFALSLQRSGGTSSSPSTGLLRARSDGGLMPGGFPASRP